MVEGLKGCVNADGVEVGVGVNSNRGGGGGVVNAKGGWER